MFRCGVDKIAGRFYSCVAALNTALREVNVFADDNVNVMDLGHFIFLRVGVGRYFHVERNVFELWFNPSHSLGL